MKAVQFCPAYCENIQMFDKLYMPFLGKPAIWHVHPMGWYVNENEKNNKIKPTPA